MNEGSRCPVSNDPRVANLMVCPFSRNVLSFNCRTVVDAYRRRAFCGDGEACANEQQDVFIGLCASRCNFSIATSISLESGTADRSARRSENDVWQIP